jgi:hypothetical protein
MPKLDTFLAQDADAPAAKDVDAALAAIWRDR